MASESFDPVNEAVLRNTIDELMQSHAFDCGINQNNDDLEKPASFTLGGTIEELQGLFGDTYKRAVSIIHRLGRDGIKNSLIIFTCQFPSDPIVSRFLLTPTNLTHCDNNQTPIDSEEAGVIRFMIAKTTWNEGLSAILATEVQFLGAIER